MYTLFFLDREEMEYRRPHVKPWEVNPESVPRSRYYFEHDNRENFQGFRGSYRGSFRGRGRGGGFIKRKFYTVYSDVNLKNTFFEFLFYIISRPHGPMSYYNSSNLLQARYARPK